MENYSLLMGAAAVMKMAVEMAAVSMEALRGHFPLRGCRNRDSCPPDLGFAAAALNFSRIVALGFEGALNRRRGERGQRGDDTIVARPAWAAPPCHLGPPGPPLALSGMGTFTKLWVPYPEDDTPFSDTLSRVCRSLSIRAPMFRGRAVISDVHTVERWEIETTIEGRLVQPTTDTVVYLKTYPDWEDGVVMAMQEALARIVYRYRNDIDEDSDIQHFGHRSSAGFCIRTKGNREGMTWTAIQFEDMERYAQKMEHHLRLEMKDCDLIKQILQENNLKYYEMKEQRDELDAEVAQLKTDNEKLQDETFKQQAIILALQAQCAHLVKQIPSSPPHPVTQETLIEEENTLKRKATEEGSPLSHDGAVKRR
ncbi:hypothetical protein QYE76_061860 [Lolium multiflorum]|uniref:Uncharacterized protein n=1 Tax=Lolium multiflorum TaxID=4521 RepID=A0AAD8S462_LOLMU|nr:hypothetical protein QYE76_061860 [Lolium multiflorum]